MGQCLGCTCLYNCVPAGFMYPMECWGYKDLFQFNPEGLMGAINDSAHIAVTDDGQLRGGKNFTFGADSCYIRTPSATKPYSLMVECTLLKRAFNAVGGVNEDNIIRVLGSRHKEQIDTIEEMYMQQYGISLIDEVQQKTKGHFQQMLLAVLNGAHHVDAECIRNAVAGIGTDEERLAEIMTTRSPADMKIIAATYEKLFQRNMKEDIDGDTTMAEEMILCALADRATFMAEELDSQMRKEKWDPTGISGAGTNETMLAHHLHSIPKSLDGLKQILADYNDNFGTGWKDDLSEKAELPDMNDVKRAFEKRYPGDTLDEVIHKDTGMDFRKACDSYIEDFHEQGARAMHEAIESPFLKRSTMVAIAVMRTNHQRQYMLEAYERMYGETLFDHLERKVKWFGGHFRRIMQDLFMDTREQFADYMHMAMFGRGHGESVHMKSNDAMDMFRTGMVGGLGTDEARMIRIIGCITRHELKEVMIRYKEKYGKDMIDDVKSELGFHFQKFIVYKMNACDGNWIWCPRQKLVRLHDTPNNCGCCQFC